MAEIRHEVRRGVHLLAAFLHCATTRRAVALCPCHFSFLPFVAAAVLTLTACSSDDDSTPSTPTQAPVLFQVNSVENATSSRSLNRKHHPHPALTTACKQLAVPPAWAAKSVFGPTTASDKPTAPTSYFPISSTTRHSPIRNATTATTIPKKTGTTWVTHSIGK